MKVDRSGNLREVLDIQSDMSESASASDGTGNYTGTSEVRRGRGDTRIGWLERPRSA